MSEVFNEAVGKAKEVGQSKSAAESLYAKYEALPVLQQLALGVAPGTGEVISAYETPKFAGKTKEAFNKGEYLKTAGLGAMTGLSALGAIPFVGAGLRAVKGGIKAATKMDEIGEGLSSLLKSEEKLEKYGKAWKADPKNKVNQRQAQDPIVKQAAQDLDSGKIKGKQFRDTVKEVLPIKPIDEMIDVPTFEEMVGALKKDQVIKGIVGIGGKKIDEGTRLATRLDIPAYNNYNKWIVSIHEGLKGGSVGYSKSARLKDVVFGSSSRTSLDIASEKLKPDMDKIRAAKKAFEKKFNRKPNKKEADQIRKDPKNLKKQDKATIARMEGNWTNTPDEDTISFTERLLKNKKDGKYIDDVGEEWVQIGMNPYRGSYFYDKATGQALQAADELVQVGPLVFAKGARKPTLSEYKKGFTTTTEASSKKLRQMEKDLAWDLPTSQSTPGGGTSAIRIKEGSIIPEDIIGTFNISDDIGKTIGPNTDKSFKKLFPNIEHKDVVDSFRKYKAKQLRELGDEPDALYHVTSKKNIPSILKKGLLKKNESKTMGKALVQKDEAVSVFTNPEDAVQWAQKIAWEKDSKVFPVIVKIAKDRTVKNKVAFKQGGQIMPMQYGGGLDDTYLNMSRRRSNAFADPNANTAFASPMSIGGLPTVYRQYGGLSNDDYADMVAEMDQADLDAGAAGRSSGSAVDEPNYKSMWQEPVTNQRGTWKPTSAEQINKELAAKERDNTLNSSAITQLWRSQEKGITGANQKQSGISGGYQPTDNRSYNFDFGFTPSLPAASNPSPINIPTQISDNIKNKTVSELKTNEQYHTIFNIVSKSLNNTQRNTLDRMIGGDDTIKDMQDKANALLTGPLSTRKTGGGLPTIYRYYGGATGDETISDITGKGEGFENVDFVGDKSVESMTEVDIPDIEDDPRTITHKAKMSPVAYDMIRQEHEDKLNKEGYDRWQTAYLNDLIGKGYDINQAQSMLVSAMATTGGISGMKAGFKDGYSYGGAAGTLQDLLETGTNVDLGVEEFFKNKKKPKEKEGIEGLYNKVLDIVSLTRDISPENIKNLNNVLAQGAKFTPNNKFMAGVVSTAVPTLAKVGISALGGEKTVGTIETRDGLSYQVGDRGGLSLNMPDANINYGPDPEVKVEEEVVKETLPDTPEEVSSMDINRSLEKKSIADPNVEIIMKMYNLTEEEANKWLGNKG